MAARIRNFWRSERENIRVDNGKIRARAIKAPTIRAYTYSRWGKGLTGEGEKKEQAICNECATQRPERTRPDIYYVSLSLLRVRSSLGCVASIVARYTQWPDVWLESMQRNLRAARVTSPGMRTRAIINVDPSLRRRSIYTTKRPPRYNVVFCRARLNVSRAL